MSRARDMNSPWIASWPVEAHRALYRYCCLGRMWSSCKRRPWPNKKRSSSRKVSRWQAQASKRFHLLVSFYTDLCRTVSNSIGRWTWACSSPCLSWKSVMMSLWLRRMAVRLLSVHFNLSLLDRLHSWENWEAGLFLVAHYYRVVVQQREG